VSFIYGNARIQFYYFLRHLGFSLK